MSPEPAVLASGASAGASGAWAVLQSLNRRLPAGRVGSRRRDTRRGRRGGQPTVFAE